MTRFHQDHLTAHQKSTPRETGIVYEDALYWSPRRAARCASVDIVAYLLRIERRWCWAVRMATKKLGYRRRKKGPQKAIVAASAKMLRIIYWVLRE
ncbi:MAG: hypothetical protein C0167_02025, partial [Nitrososphaera sp.]